MELSGTALAWPMKVPGFQSQSNQKPAIIPIIHLFSLAWRTLNGITRWYRKHKRCESFPVLASPRYHSTGAKIGLCWGEAKLPLHL